MFEDITEMDVLRDQQYNESRQIYNLDQKECDAHNITYMRDKLAARWNRRANND